MRWRTNWVNPSFQCQWLFKEGQWKILTRKEQKNWKPDIQNIIEETETYRLLFSVEGKVYIPSTINIWKKAAQHNQFGQITIENCEYYAAGIHLKIVYKHTHFTFYAKSHRFNAIFS